MELAQEDVNKRWEILEEMAKDGNGAAAKITPHVANN
jgi:hypothetical protein